jgi:heme/copper-type cytochrome/quinol oxidase subunit 2
MDTRAAARAVVAGLALGAGALALMAWGAENGPLAGLRAQEQAPVQRNIAVTARKFAFQPGRIEVNQNDLVRITLRSDDIRHSFTIDAYRIAKLVNGGQSVTFEFRADQAGTFPIYCNLRQEDGCRNMRGELVVHAK